MKNSKYWHDEPVFQNRTPEYFYGYKCPYCGAKLKPIDQITLLTYGKTGNGVFKD